MPRFDLTDLTSRPLTGTGFTYSATRIDRLAASEWTLVAIAADMSGSVHPFRADIEACIQETVEACRLSPRADNLMLRLVGFRQTVEELHGFKPLMECPPAAYAGCLDIGGSTALYDAAVSTLRSVEDYAKTLDRRGMVANGIVFVLTDGADNASTLTPGAVRDAVEQAVRGETLESLVTVLVGVGVGASVGRDLLALSGQVGFDHYLQLERADAATLAKLADFLSRSIQAQSSVLGSGGPSQVLTF